MTIADTEQFARRVVSAVPPLEPLLREHLEDNGGELLAFVFFGEVSRWASYEIEVAPQSRELATLLELLEEGYESGGYVRGLIEVSFIENIWDQHKFDDVLGPNLRPLFQQESGLIE